MTYCTVPNQQNKRPLPSVASACAVAAKAEVRADLTGHLVTSQRGVASEWINTRTGPRLGVVAQRNRAALYLFDLRITRSARRGIETLFADIRAADATSETWIADGAGEGSTSLAARVPRKFIDDLLDDIAATIGSRTPILETARAALCEVAQMPTDAFTKGRDNE